MENFSKRLEQPAREKAYSRDYRVRVCSSAGIGGDFGGSCYCEEAVVKTLFLGTSLLPLPEFLIGTFSGAVDCIYCLRGGTCGADKDC